ncbi:hypothetical protein DACRYDRAFT_15230 [Dacryopinax primogenitus]|uniref:Uncharacterized protein n=1 Tax=Dacryopinax primogenitus (strain DJM 731) TaxID=1858805 RepID=M5GDM3_DACPD|nr:uncharacterized protein DACRYDRAFT_15230 [Dacryopinax primogenitus]EJU02533.1 hypothetical protein DACRYDRAFT_15230 [Dacryopinax primogenitus]
MESQLYSLLARHDQIESIVPNIDAVVPRLVFELGGYASSTKAKVKVTGLVFMSDLEFIFEGIKKKFGGKNIGVPLVGGKCELQIVTTILALNVNFLRSGKIFAMFIGVYPGLSAANGIFTGQGQWLNDV